jgi:hypothetical protein
MKSSHGFPRMSTRDHVGYALRMEGKTSARRWRRPGGPGGGRNNAAESATPTITMLHSWVRIGSRRRDGIGRDHHGDLRFLRFTKELT